MSKQFIKYSDIVAAQQTMKGITKVTSLLPTKSFSQMADANVYLKLENLQITGSFKVRGAYNKIATLSKEEMQRPVVAASAGNHAQGVAYSSTKLGLKSTIFMPTFTPPLKVIATRSYGANVILGGDTFDDAYAASQEYCEKNKASYIHPFNDPKVIAGQGVIGLEIFQQLPEVEVVIIPIGGGGLISGMAIALKEMNPKIKIIGVEAEGAACMYASRKANQMVTLPQIHTIADGIAVKRPGDLTFDIIQNYVDDLVTVNDGEIAHAAYILLQRGKLLAEPSGVASVAAAIFKKCNLKGKNVVPVISGGNINMSLLEQIVEQGMMSDGLRATIQVIIPDQAGELRKLLAIFEQLKVNIQDIIHERSTISVQVGYVLTSFTVNLQDKSQLDIITKELRDRGLECKVMK
ncbi:MAG: threonine ammonia-lyase [Bacteroidales bacterium]